MSTLWSFKLNGYSDCLVSHGFSHVCASGCYLRCCSQWHKYCLLASSGKFLLLSSALNSCSSAVSSSCEQLRVYCYCLASLIHAFLELALSVVAFDKPG